VSRFTRRKYRMSQRVTYKGEHAIVINNESLTMLNKVVILTTIKKERLEVSETDLVKGWQ
jgi:hypothetical protein